MRDLADVEIDRFLSQAEYLGQLVNHPAWPGWEALLREMRQAYMEEMARCADPNEFRYWQGAVGALGEILDRPRRIVKEADGYRAAEEEEKNVLRPELRSVIGAGIDPDGDV